MGRAGVLLDRDGTVIVDHGYVGSVERVDLIDGAAEAIAELNRANIPVAIVTNQAGVARGYYGLDDVEAVHAHLTALLASHGAHVDRYLFCPYHPDGSVPAFARQSFDRKPGPGMALAAAQALDLDLNRSWVIGDRPEDMQLADAVGASGVFIGSTPDEHDGIWTFPDLRQAVQFVMRRMKVGTGGDALATPLRSAPMRPKFPSAGFDGAGSFLRAYVGESAKAARSVDPFAMDRATAMLRAAYDTGAVVYTCGNGGSASIANHFQCDHLKGVRTSTDLWPRVVSLSSNVELMTAIANDISYEDVFVYQLESQARAGDVLVAVSSSGESMNIVRAVDWARSHGMGTIALTGFSGGKARELADVAMHVDSSNYGVIEDNHQAIMHALAQYLRQSHMSADEIATCKF